MKTLQLWLGLVIFSLSGTWFHSIAEESSTSADAAKWAFVTAASGKPHLREECAFVRCGGLFYLVGGRGINPVDIFDPKNQTWTEGAKPPIEVHHFQPVVWQNRIYIACAMTGGFPTEKPLNKILIYDPQKNEWSWGDQIPPLRRRGSAGVVLRDDKLYLACGIINGHTNGWVNIFDSYDLKTGEWTVLPDAPRARDHFEAALVDGKLYLAGGRRSSAITHQVFDLTIPEVDVFDFQSNAWSTLPPSSNLPILRAGASTVAVGSDLIVFGGESMKQLPAHSEVEALDTLTGKWRGLPSLLEGRHGTGVISYDGTFYTCVGSGHRGGGPLLSTMECLKFP